MFSRGILFADIHVYISLLLNVSPEEIGVLCTMIGHYKLTVVVSTTQLSGIPLKKLA
jgi:hypothetical protein